MFLSMPKHVCTRQNVFCSVLERNNSVFELYSSAICGTESKRNFSTLQCVGRPKNVDILENVNE